MGINHYTTAAHSAITNNDYSAGRVTTIVQAGSQYADLDPSNLVVSWDSVSPYVHCLCCMVSIY